MPVEIEDFFTEADITEQMLESALGSLSPEYRVFKHLHHADILRLLEQCRYAKMEVRGAANESFLRRGELLVLSRIDVRFLREVTPGRIRISCGPFTTSGKFIRCKQKILNSMGKSAVEAEVEQVFMSAVTKRGIEPPAEFMKISLRG